MQEPDYKTAYFTIYEIAKQMRTAQKLYFKTRLSIYLEQSKKLERQLDSYINHAEAEEAKKQTPWTLFDKSGV